MHINHSHPFSHAARGFAMLEVLISILVIAFGLLGLAGLQGYSIRMTHGSYLRNQASLYAYDIADRIRANRDGYVNNYYHLGTAADTAACHPTASPSGCTASQMAGYDLWVWNQLLAQLPKGEGVVCIDSTPNDGTSAANHQCDHVGIQYAAKIWWDEQGSTHQFAFDFQP